MLCVLYWGRTPLLPLVSTFPKRNKYGSHKVRTGIYKEYHSVCPLVGIGTLPTPLASECAPPPERGGGGHIRRRVRGWGSPNSDDLRKSLALCLFCG